ncbi:hypothetical protein ALQ56_05780 [Pseudomonas syringae pv. papulans]|nr:hypothetical protein ALQ56_05780 [Pseudomonas syringae pv. papulans]
MLNGRRRFAGRRSTDLFRADLTALCRQWHARRGLGVGLEQLVEAPVSQACRTPLFPDGDQLIDGAEDPPHEDRTGDHHAGGHVSVYHQQCAQAQHQRLQTQTQGLADRTDHRASVTGPVLQGQKAPMHMEPTAPQHFEHAHRLDRLGLLQVSGRQLCGLLRVTAGFGQRFAGQPFVEAGQSDQQHRAHAGEHAKPGVEKEDHRQVDGEPRGVEEREQRRPGEKLADEGQVTQRLSGLTLPGVQIALERGLIDAQIETLFQLAADADHHKAADHLQQADKRKEPDYHQRQHGQGGLVLRRQYAVIDLQHVNRWGEHQHVDQGGKTTDTNQRALVVSQRFIKRRPGALGQRTHGCSLMILPVTE